ncbi:DNA polymerase III subunit delta' [Aerococcus sp. Group 2]|uniref:DNA polymerase III subunit delta' n=1 Tax=Aerococcus sp. Group 2 TaxID=2976811 RepID=UPI0018A7213A|nr:DNA polymerase III subunit delta' [Aerococcus sp. Group 2]
MTQAFAIEEKQSQLAQLMRQVIQNGRLAHAYLFEGNAGSGQADMAIFLAAALFCSQEDKPCGQCDHCQRVIRGDHSDVEWLTKDANSIKIDQIRELKHNLSLTGLEGRVKVFVIEAAETMTVQAANSLLKFLEEPHQDVYIFLLTNNREAILPTVQSRCQVIHFPSLAVDQAVRLFVDHGIGKAQAQIIAWLTTDLDSALALNDNQVFHDQCQRLDQWLQLIVARDGRAFTMVATDWMKLSRSRQDNQLLLQLLTLLLRDCLLIKSQSDQETLDQVLVRPDLKTNRQAKYQAYPEGLFLDLLKLVTKAQKMIKQNVSPQASLGYFVLEAWNLEKKYL